MKAAAKKKEQITPKAKPFARKLEISNSVDHVVLIDQQIKELQEKKQSLQNRFLATFLKTGENRFCGTSHTVNISEGERTSYDIKAMVAYYGEDELEEFKKETTEFVRMTISNKKPEKKK